MPPIWSKKSFPVPTAPEERTNVSMTTMPSTAIRERPSRLRMLNASNGLKAIADPRVTTAVLDGRAGAGLDSPRRGVLLGRGSRFCSDSQLYRCGLGDNGRPVTPEPP